MKRLLIIEPYYGGSHKRFLDGLAAVLDADVKLLRLPARKWKMRMQLSAPWFVGQIESLDVDKRFFDTVLFSSFIDVAVFKAMAATLEGWNPACRYCTYFHENQFEYPGYLEKHTNHQFTAINFTTALISDTTAFNSHFNRNSFLTQCGKYLAKAADMDLAYCGDRLEQNSQVIYPGIDFSRIDSLRSERRTRTRKRIVWNHRWEHDKNPEAFFDVMCELADEGVDFDVSLLGQSFRNRPACFEKAREKLGDRIVNFGFLENIDDYYRCLLDGDIVVSTAVHEFFGISVLEAVRAGCLPVLPDRLSYPELFDECYLYEDGRLYERLRVLLESDVNLPDDTAVSLTEPYDWRHQAYAFKTWLAV